MLALSHVTIFYNKTAQGFLFVVTVGGARLKYENFCQSLLWIWRKCCVYIEERNMDILEAGRSVSAEIEICTNHWTFDRLLIFLRSIIMTKRIRRLQHTSYFDDSSFYQKWWILKKKTKSILGNIIFHGLEVKYCKMNNFLLHHS